MKTYLIDYENVRSQGLTGITNLEENDEVVIFYTDAANTITVDMHFDIINSKAKVSFRKVANGTQNALDFQLSTYLGYLIGINPEAEFVIISKDSGYSAVLKFWKPTHKVSLFQQICQAISKGSEQTIAMIEAKQPAKMIQSNSPAKMIEPPFPFDKSEITAALKGEDIDFDWLFKVISQFYVEDQIKLQQLYTEMIKKYKAEYGRAIYKKLKPLLKVKK